MQIIRILLQMDNYASTSSLNTLYIFPPVLRHTKGKIYNIKIIQLRKIVPSYLQRVVKMIYFYLTTNQLIIQLVAHIKLTTDLL